jgi:hypothetical protein
MVGQEIEFLQRAVRTAPPGDVIVAGSFKGGDVMAMCEADPSRHFVVIDSFFGVADPSERDFDTPHVRGQFSVGGLDRYKQNFVDAGYPVPDELHMMFIDAAALQRVPRRPAALVWLDLDHFQPTLDCMRHFWPWVVEGGIMMTHDYRWPHCPGVEQAVKETGWDWRCDGGMTIAYLRKAA